MEAMKNAMAKPNMALEKVPMPERDPKERATCFEEVAMGYTPEMAMEEATRCLNCKAKPCVAGCRLAFVSQNLFSRWQLEIS